MMSEEGAVVLRGSNFRVLMMSDERAESCCNFISASTWEATRGEVSIFYLLVIKKKFLGSNFFSMFLDLLEI